MHALLLIALCSSIDRSGLHRLIRKQLPTVRACYARALGEQTPEFGGKLVLQFVIGPAGSVTEAKITESQLKSEKFEACVTGAVKAWRFPKPAGGERITVTYPIIFKAAE